ncbi:MAG: RNA polymerase sigma-70 factor [Bacteroidota bacterium]|nr:RNA polymerase sigma-70 factor [Bacteroidota bacterium]
MKSDSELILKIQDEDNKAFEEFFDSFYPLLCIFANKYLHDPDAASDIAQDAFVYFWKKKHDIPNINSAKSFLFTIVRNKSLNYIRNKKTRETIHIKKLESEIYFRDNIIEQETYQIIYKAIKTLSPQSQIVIDLALDGLKNHEIAEQLNLSVNTIKTIKQRAFKLLRTELKDNIFALFYIELCNIDEFRESTKSGNH